MRVRAVLLAMVLAAGLSGSPAGAGHVYPTPALGCVSPIAPSGHCEFRVDPAITIVAEPFLELRVSATVVSRGPAQVSAQLHKFVEGQPYPYSHPVIAARASQGSDVALCSQSIPFVPSDYGFYLCQATGVGAGTLTCSLN